MRLAVIPVAMALLGSCNIYKKFELPTEESQLIAAYSQAKQEAMDSTAFGNLDWRMVFTDPMLADLIEQALANNLDLENARLNVDIAQAQLKGARLSFLPSISLAPNGALAKYFVEDASWAKTYQLPINVSWEIDLFGKLLNGKRGAESNLLRTQAYQQAVRSQVISAVASCYYTIAAIKSQIALSNETAESWLASVEVMKNLKEAGRVTEAAVVQSQAQYYSIRASITDLETALTKANNSMSLLLNVMPQSYNVSPTAMLTMPAELKDAIPLSQLAARPDVAAAEQNLAVAYYATNQARAAFYPSLNITANGGFTNLVGSLITNPGKWFINLAASLVAPLFARGQMISGLEAAKASQAQALNNFETTVLSAASEVSNAMTVYANTKEKEKYLIMQAENLTKSVDYTTELLSIGGYGTTYLEVLTAQQNLLSAQLAEISCREAAALAVINLYQSLGGGR